MTDLLPPSSAGPEAPQHAVTLFALNVTADAFANIVEPWNVPCRQHQRGKRPQVGKHEQPIAHDRFAGIPDGLVNNLKVLAETRRTELALATNNSRLRRSTRAELFRRP
jgi:predicted NAD/FAD-dependent oxidoreductase